MKKRWRKLFGAALVLTLAFSVGCSLELPWGKNNKTEPVESSITLAQDQMSLKVGDSSYIVPSFEAQDGVSVVYRSSDESVVSVTEYGQVYALKEGTAEVIVTYGELQTGCRITVSLGGELPKLIVNGIEEGSTQKLSLGDNLAINPYVYFNSKRYDDATLSYTVSDPTVATVENGELVAKSRGETSVQIKATWRGVENATLERNFTVEVIGNVEISVNGGLNSVVNLYTVPEITDRTYDIELPFVVTANETKDGVETALMPTVTVLSGEELITIEDEKISSNGVAGTATVKISCVSSTNETFEQIISVNVLRSVGVYEPTVPFSAVDGELPVSDIFGREELLVAAKCAGETLTISEDQTRVLGLSTLSDRAINKTITVYGEKVGYEVQVEAYTKILYEASDLDHFLLDNEASNDIKTKFGGYYVLANDIDASGYVRGTSGFVSTGSVTGYATVGLTGTFDGRGHTISNLTFGEVASDFEKFDAEKRKEYTYSLFGVIGGGTVKDLALENVTFAAPDAVTKGSQAALATWIMGGRIENVYVRVNGLNYSAGKWRASAGLAYSIDEKTMLKNCILEVEDDGTVQAVKDKSGNQLGAAYGSLVGDRLPADDVLAKNWKNVYVISADPLSATYANVTDESGATVRKATVVDALNANIYANRTVTGIKRYTNVSDFMFDVDNDHSAFDGNCWNLAGAVPVWKGLESERYARVTVNDRPMKELTIDVAQASGEYSIGVELLGEEIGDYTFTSEGVGLAISDNAFTVIHAGMTEFKILFAGQELTLTVNVTSETTNYAKTVEFSAMHGELPLADIFGTENVELVAAFQGETALTISEDKKCVLGVQTLGADGKIVNDRAVQTQITVYTATKGAVIDLNAYAGILTKAEDLQVFCLDNTDYQTLVGQTAADRSPDKVIEGYYVLGNDIDASQYAMPTHGYISSTYYTTTMSQVGFQGMFDGRGYTISDVTFGAAQEELGSDSTTEDTYWKNNNYSLLGIIGKNAVVKNFALTNVKFDCKYGTKAATMSSCMGLAMWIVPGASVENVYVSVKGIVGGGNANYSTVSALAYGISSGATLNNVVSEYIGDTSVVATKVSAFVARKFASDNSTEIKNWTNVYAIGISEDRIVNCITAVSSGIDSALLYANNYTGDILEAADKVAGLYQYETNEKWTAAKDSHDFTSFSATYWDLTSGVPVFKKASA